MMISGFPERRACVRTGLTIALFAILLPGFALAASDAHAGKSPCPDGTANEMARRIQSRYEGIRTIHADFVQTSVSASFAGQPLMETEPKAGRVVFAKPGKMRWTYLEPEPSVVVSDGRVLWIYDVEGHSVTRLEVTAGFLSGAALQFLLGDGRILEAFEVEATACDGDRISLDLIPRADATYEKLGLVADRESGDILATSVLDLFGNLTRIEFSRIRVNQAPVPGAFEFEIPDGVEVIDYAGSGADSGPGGFGKASEGEAGEEKASTP